MKYKLYFEKPHQQKIQIHLEIPAGNQPVEIWQPKWRPGRYEIASYAENYCDVSAETASGKPLSVEKTATNKWQVQAPGNESGVFKYSYYAHIRDAGGSWLDEKQVYINGVNLFCYFPDAIDEPSSFELNVPDDYKIACGLRREGKTLYAEDFHQLVDAPLIASADLQKISYEEDGIPFYLWFQGNVRPETDRLIKDFRAFTRATLDLFGSFPVKEYHFLFQIHDRDFYHGVEHYNSTVIALGPGYKLFEKVLYDELLGVSCHELFHTWNVKAIRPSDMRPYRYDEENYCRLHYVTEGVTTYYGDLLLLKGGVWSPQEYLKVFNQSLLGRYYRNDGHRHISLEEASHDSWINGYKLTIPNRKISFYTKGALVAFCADIRIRRATINKKSLDDVMKLMWERFGKTETGYTKADYKGLLEEVSGENWDGFFRDFIEGTKPLEDELKRAGEFIGWEWKAYHYPRREARDHGFVLEKKAGKLFVKQVFENTIADQAGLAPGDEVIAVNGLRADPDGFGHQLEMFANEGEIRLHIFREDEMRRFVLKPDPENGPPYYQFSFSEPDGNAAPFLNMRKWANQ